ncbi:hypothetical protein SELMODRAFT_406655 [Selaginella moellendorffii]|uniref:Peptidase A1 domain-containing protein n=1 Tax=Selaginella moellendorffii TaxID=88036 RepID=D8R116_SELML|nr:hypothetical protein SELMODRAFT_406655 [Selaginella moellendorffii]
MGSKIIFLVFLYVIVSWAQIVRLPLDSTQSGLWATIPVNGVPISFLVDTGSSGAFVLDELDLDDIRESFIQAPEVDGVDCIYCRNISFSNGVWVKGHVKKSKWLVDGKLRRTRFLLADEWMTKRPDGSRGNTVKALLGLSRRMDSVVTQWKYTSFSILYTGVFSELVFGVPGHPYDASVVGLVENQNILTTRVYRISYGWKYEEYAFDMPWDTGSEDTWFEPKILRIISDMIKSKVNDMYYNRTLDTGCSRMGKAYMADLPPIEFDLGNQVTLSIPKSKYMSKFVEGAGLCLNIKASKPAFSFIPNSSIRVFKSYDYSHLQTTMTMNGKS